MIINPFRIDEDAIMALLSKPKYKQKEITKINPSLYKVTRTIGSVDKEITFFKYGNIWRVSLGGVVLARTHKTVRDVKFWLYVNNFTYFHN